MNRLRGIKEAARLTCLGRDLTHPWLICPHEEAGKVTHFTMWPREGSYEDWDLSFTLDEVEGRSPIDEGLRAEFEALMGWLGEGGG